MKESTTPPATKACIKFDLPAEMPLKDYDKGDLIEIFRISIDALCKRRSSIQLQLFEFNPSTLTMEIGQENAMWVPEEVIKILDEAIKEATTYADELRGCSPWTEGHRLYEFWTDRKYLLGSVKMVVLGKRDTLKAYTQRGWKSLQGKQHAQERGE